MSEELTERAKRAEQQAKWWKYAAWTMPFVALALIVFTHFIGFTTWYEQVIVATATVFFTVSVLWWWWALNKLVDIMKGLEATALSLSYIKDGIRDFKKALRLNNRDSDR